LFGNILKTKNLKKLVQLHERKKSPSNVLIICEERMDEEGGYWVNIRRKKKKKY